MVMELNVHYLENTGEVKGETRGFERFGQGRMGYGGEQWHKGG